MTSCVFSLGSISSIILAFATWRPAHGQEKRTDRGGAHGQRRSARSGIKNLLGSVPPIRISNISKYVMAVGMPLRHHAPRESFVEAPHHLADKVAKLEELKHLHGQLLLPGVAALEHVVAAGQERQLQPAL